jgi:hypothetical protein
MNSVRISGRLFCQVVTALFLVTAPALAQDGTDTGLAVELYTTALPIGVPDGQKIIPVRVLREFELGTALERFASTTNRLLEKRQKELADAAWKVDERTTVTPTAMVVRNALQRDEQRLGAQLNYYAKGDRATGAKDERSSHILDLDELKELEITLNALIRALDQAPAEGEIITLQYRSRSGFSASLTLTPKSDGVAVNAAVGKVSGDSREKARRMFLESGAMVHQLINYLASF